MLKSMVNYYAAEACVKVKADVSKGTIVAPRIIKDGMLWIIVNMDGNGGEVQLPDYGYNPIEHKKVKEGLLNIAPYECKVIQFLEL